MRVRKLLTERFQDYKLPAMYLASCFCDWKCCPDNPTVCQNNPVVHMPITDISDDEILDAYQKDPITQAIIIAGLEPLLQIHEVCALIRRAVERRIKTTFVIYTGYDKNEVKFIGFFDALKDTGFSDSVHVIMKYGRYIPDQKPHFDEVLGVELASDNQYAEMISNQRLSTQKERDDGSHD